MKHLATLDVQQSKNGSYTYTIHCNKKITTATVKTLNKVFEKVEEVIDESRRERADKASEEFFARCKVADKDSKWS